MIVIGRWQFSPSILRFVLALAVTFAIAIPHPGYSSASHLSGAAGVHGHLTHDGATDGAGTGSSAVAAICAFACNGSDPYALARIDRPPSDAMPAAWFAEVPFWRIAAGPDPALRPPETLRPA